MDSLSYFDCNCSVGMRGVVNPGSFYRTEDLDRKMKSCGIARALVYHFLAKEYDPLAGNNMLMEEIKNYPSMYPVWAVMHHHTEEFPEPVRLIELMKQNGVKAVRMFPAQYEHNYSMADWNCKELFDVLEAHEVPLLLGLDSIGWDGLFRLCTDHPALKVIITEADYRIDRNLYSMLKRFKNLYLEIMGYKVHDGIEEICSRFGAERLVFGSGMPIYSGASVICMLTYARIGDNEKCMIASGNLDRLMGGVKL
jgi:predicted TIM-barrel fold metal-dependent hydrolase